jgi:capsular polysaccharide transport system permease protein
MATSSRKIHLARPITPPHGSENQTSDVPGEMIADGSELPGGNPELSARLVEASVADPALIPQSQPATPTVIQPQHEEPSLGITTRRRQSAAPESARERQVPTSRKNRQERLAARAESFPIEELIGLTNPPRSRASASSARGNQVDRQHEPNVTKRTLKESTNNFRDNPPAAILLSLPARIRRRSRITFISFLICVGFPLLLATLYFFFIASDQYVSEFRFAVRDSQSAISGTDAAASAAGVTVATSTVVQNYMVTDYLTSRQVVDELQNQIDVRGLYSRPETDWISRFNSRQPMERFALYWKRMVSATYDPITGLAIVEVRAFTAEDARLVASHLATMAEKLVNDISSRPQRDAVRFAEDALHRAEDRLKTVTTDLRRFRDTEQVIDPTTNIVASNVLLAQTLRSYLAQLRTELSSLNKQNLDTTAPMAQALQSRIKATREQLAAVEAEVPRSRDGANPISKVMGEYERLDLERQFAQGLVTTMMQTLEQARLAASVQHLYVQSYVTPFLPQSALYPKRFISVAIVAFVSLLVWTIGLLLVRSIREQMV